MTETGQTRTTGEGDQLLVEVRPSLRTSWRTSVTPAQLVLWVAGVYLAVRLVADGQVVVLGFAGSVLALGILAALVWRFVGRFEVTGDELRRRDPLGRTRSAPRSQVAEALFLPEYRRDVGGRPSGLLVFLDDARRPLLRLEGHWWGRDRLATIAEAAGVAAGVPVRRLPDGLTPGQFAERRLYELPWRHRHPYLTDVLLGLVVLAVTLPVVLLVLTR